MGEMARIIRNGDNQSVELPDGFRFGDAEVRISREGQRVVLEPAVDEPYDPSAIDPQTGLTFGQIDALVQEGLDSGPDEPWDVEELKRDLREQLEAEGLPR